MKLMWKNHVMATFAWYLQKDTGKTHNIVIGFLIRVEYYQTGLTRFLWQSLNICPCYQSYLDSDFIETDLEL